MAFRKVAEFKEMSLDYSSSGGNATVQLYTDLPGGAMAARLTGKTLANSNSDRRTPTIPLDGVEGTLFRPEITPAAGTVLRLYGGIVYLRPIGVYLDGSIGEKWTTQPIPVGV